MKKVFGFKVLINDKPICRAGFEKDNSVVTCILNSIRRERDESEILDINVGGLNSETEQYVDWFNGALQEGDKITIEIIKEDFDPPATIRNSSGKRK